MAAQPQLWQGQAMRRPVILLGEFAVARISQRISQAWKELQRLERSPAKSLQNHGALGFCRARSCGESIGNNPVDLSSRARMSRQRVFRIPKLFRRQGQAMQTPVELFR